LRRISYDSSVAPRTNRDSTSGEKLTKVLLETSSHMDRTNIQDEENRRTSNILGETGFLAMTSTYGI